MYVCQSRSREGVRANPVSGRNEEIDELGLVTFRKVLRNKKFAHVQSFLRIWLTTHVYETESNLNPNCNTLEPDGPPKEPPQPSRATYVFTQQCCSATLASLYFHCRKRKSVLLQKGYYAVFFLVGGSPASEIYVSTFRNTLFHMWN